MVYDLTGGDFVERSWRCTAHGGRYLAVGFADDDDNGMTGRPLRMACIGNIDIVAVMVAWADSVDPGMRRFGFNPFGRDVADEIHADLLRLVADGTIRPVVGRRVTMEEAGPRLDDHEAAPLAGPHRRRGGQVRHDRHEQRRVHVARLRAAQPAPPGPQLGRGAAGPLRAHRAVADARRR